MFKKFLWKQQKIESSEICCKIFFRTSPSIFLISQDYSRSAFLCSVRLSFTKCWNWNGTSSPNVNTVVFWRLSLTFRLYVCLVLGHDSGLCNNSCCTSIIFSEFFAGHFRFNADYCNYSQLICSDFRFRKINGRFRGNIFSNKRERHTSVKGWYIV